MKTRRLWDPSARRIKIMTYALLQTSIAPPPVEALQRAFRSSDSLASADAMFVVDDAFGILARDLPADDAQHLAASLASENVEVELVAERDLPRLPDATFFTGIQLADDCMRVYNAREDITELPYRGLSLIAVGYDGEHVRFELVFGDATVRFNSDLQSLHFRHSPELHGRSPGENLLLLIRRLREITPHSILNRGAETLCLGNPVEHVEDFVTYPRTSAFFEEIVWLLWRARRDQANSEPS
jgi:hypothetical protein